MKKLFSLVLALILLASAFVLPAAGEEQVGSSPEKSGAVLHGVQDALRGDSYAIRFVGSIESLKYQLVGFYITAQDGSYYWNKSATAVYTTLLGKTQGGEMKQYSAAELRGEASYLYALELTDIPLSLGTVSFTVTPYAVKEDGETPVTGKSYTFVYTNGVFQRSSEASFEELSFSTSKAYTLVYNTGEMNAEAASKYAAHLADVSGLRVTAGADTASYTNEILLGSMVNRTAAMPVPQGAYTFGISEGKYVISANDAVGYAMGISYLAQSLKQSMTLSADSELRGWTAELPHDGLTAVAYALARSVAGTYGSYVEYQIAEKLNPADRSDVALVKALIERMDKGFAVSVGSSSALYKGSVVKLDRNDYSKVTKYAGGRIYIAQDFAKRYFGGDPATDGEGYVELGALCGQNYELYYHESTGIAVVTPAAVIGFSNLTQTVGGYTNAQYLARMEQFFNNPRLPEPDVPVEGTRVEVIANEYDPAYILDYTQVVYECYGSPEILHRTENGTDVLYMTYDIAQMQFAEETNTNTTLSYDTEFVRSFDGGKTWTKLAFFERVTYVGMIEHEGQLILMGTQKSETPSSSGQYPTHVWIAFYDPASGVMKKEINTGIDAWGTAPTSIVIQNGRIYRAHNYGVVSADLSKDLSKKANWTKTAVPREVLTKADYANALGIEEKSITGTYLLEEGNVVVAPDGVSLYVLYRIDASPTWGYAAAFALSSDGTTLTKLAASKTGFADGIIRFPGNQTKFQIRYDQKTGMYLTLVNICTQESDSPHRRNVLALVASSDLVSWQTVGIMLTDREMMNDTHSAYAHAFQYVSFDFVGDDLVMVVREAVGNACNYHNSNAITMYTLNDYEAYIRAYLNLQ